MKITLINPPDWNQIIYSSNEVIAYNRGYYPPLGLMYIASTLMKEGGYQVEIIDGVMERLDYGQLSKRLNASQPDFVGITAFTMNLVDTAKTAQCAREAVPNAHVCIGGPHVNIFPRETLSFDCVDSVVVGEGEYTCLTLVRAIEKKSSLEGIPGHFFKKNGTIISTPPGSYTKDLDCFPFPARKLTKYKEYWSALGEAKPGTTMMTTRGCPCRCTFCWHEPVLRKRSIHNVMEEVEQCINLGIKEIFFFDENFTIDRRRVNEFCNEMTSHGRPIPFDIRARVDTVNFEMLRSLKKAGCRRIQFGVESGAQKTLDRIKKGITLKQAEDAFVWARMVGLITYADFMIGLPGERLEDIHQTINFAKKLKPDYVQFSSLFPLPDTEIYSEGRRLGIFSGDYWRDFARNPVDSFKPEFWTEFFSAEQIHQLCNRANWQFYFRPSYILRQILRIRSLMGFFWKTRVAVGLFRNFLVQRLKSIELISRPPSLR